jgi:hypothetical protein
VKALAALKGVLLFFIIGFVAVTLYHMVRPQYDWWYCIMNPASCVQQSAFDSIANVAATLFNPLIIMVLAAGYFLARMVPDHKKK